MRFSENFEAAKNIAVEAAQTAAAKAKELAAVAKANISIYAEEDKVKKAESFAQREKIEEGRAVAGESKHGFEDQTEDRKDNGKQKQIAQ